MTINLEILGLYDIIIFADDSGSISTREPKEDNMSRFEILKNVIETIGFWTTLLDPDGIVVRFFNSSIEAMELEIHRILSIYLHMYDQVVQLLWIKI